MLMQVVVTDSRTKTPTTFVCNDWIRTEVSQGCISHCSPQHAMLAQLQDVKKQDGCQAWH
jgi:hypothetical protein